MDAADLLDELPADRRLALAYARPAMRDVVLGLLLLDLRLARIVSQAREPILGQIRLAWWRDRLGEPLDKNPAGEPLLALLSLWGPRRAGLVGLVDGWEALLGETTIESAELEAFAAGRGAAFAELARVLGCGDAADEAGRAGRSWALADLAANLGKSDETGLALQLAQGQDWRPAQLPRAMRPLAILYGLARRKRGSGPLLAGLGDGLCAVRLGLFGK
jgi:phytoene synthase